MKRKWGCEVDRTIFCPHGRRISTGPTRRPEDGHKFCAFGHIGESSAGYKETFQHGMIAYVILLAAFSATYNKLPPLYAAIASQKNYMSVYLINIYGNPDDEKGFVKQYEATGKKSDMVKSWVRFKDLESLPLVLIGEGITRTPVAEYIRIYEDSRKKS